MKKIRLPYPLSRIRAEIRRWREERWMRRWHWYAMQNNVKPVHD